MNHTEPTAPIILWVRTLEQAFAPPQNVAAFTVKLDRYDTATVQGLMDNEHDLSIVRKDIEAMLLKAHTLPDGRRVFKTEDGTRVFDEHGAELKAEEITPDAISNDKPYAEKFFGRREEERLLVAERKELVTYQDKLDHARERSKDPTFTQGELDALEQDIGESMPARVRKLSGEQAPEQQSHLAAGLVADRVAAPQDRDRLIMTPAVFQP